MRQFRLLAVLAVCAVAVVLSACGETTAAISHDDVLDVQVETEKTANGPLTHLLTNGEGEKVMGVDDKIVVSATGDNLPARYRPLIDAFGKISMGCTATHIGDGLVLSAGHCFSAPSTQVVDRPCSDTVEWGYRKNAVVYLTSTCTKILAMEWNSNRDYALFRVTPVPPPFIPVDVTALPSHGRSISIFGHPELRPLEWSPAGTLSGPACVLIANQFADGGFHGVDMFDHQCDTEPGNSGSTVIDDVTLKVVGIHNGGIVPWNYATYLTPLVPFLTGIRPDGGTTVDAGVPDAGAADAGIPDAGAADAGVIDAGVADAGSGVVALTNGQPVSGLSGATGSQKFFSIWVPAGASSLAITLSGGAPDADLYVRRGQLPTASAYDCRPYTGANNESCSFSNPQGDLWYVMIRGYSAYSGASLVAQYATGGGFDGGSPVDAGTSLDAGTSVDAGTGPSLFLNVPVTNLSGASGSAQLWRLDLPSGLSTLTVATTGGAGDADLYVRHAAAPTTSTYDCRPFSSSSQETCTFTSPAGGSWYVMLRGYSAYSGVTLTAH